MEFGKLANIDGIDWSLPKDREESMTFLRGLPRKTAPKFYIGTPAWGHKEWVGKIYAIGTKPADYLSRYAKSFNTIELNTTHYRIPTADQATKWREQVADRSDFIFCPKVFQGISHAAGGLLDKKLLQEWFYFLNELKDNRGPCFIQMPPYFDYSKKATLFHFLEQWPGEFELAIEFRHASWFEGPRILPALEKYLRTKKISVVITDVAGRRDLLHTSLTADFVMLRFIGNNLHPTDFTRALAWSEKFAAWCAQGLSRVFYFAHEPDDINAPEISQAIIRHLNEEGGAELPPLQWQT
ncbi:hypothetical protein AZI86_01470 [Bdellovibrio bacteriovorus]|uniref:DUF72 domain-containing protein n=1 Tax=Bdellovibrio bacteriovorus TaxID=959 RepID=A0A150WMQ5_BDEBC|nr:DUF72 domain-containing protein [Bdellovibrio bacteriovorus]KYG65771.1 hypothetical protein AZI86_01470 [Bdellovibrio bacteriovorus]